MVSTSRPLVFLHTATRAARIHLGRQSGIGTQPRPNTVVVDQGLGNIAWVWDDAITQYVCVSKGALSPYIWSNLSSAQTSFTLSTTETIIGPSITVKGNALTFANDWLEVTHMLGVTLANNASARTWRFRLRWGGLGGTIIADTGTIAAAQSRVVPTLVPVTNRLQVQFRTIGATGTVLAWGEQANQWASAALSNVNPWQTNAFTYPVVIDTTADKVLCLTAISSANGLGDIITCETGLVHQGRKTS